MGKQTICVGVALIAIVVGISGAFGQSLVGPSSYPHTTDGKWTDWSPGAAGAFEWFDIGFFKGAYSWYSADFIPTQSTLYIMNDFFGNTQGLDPTDYNLFRVWLDGMTQSDAYEIRVYPDDTVLAWRNGAPVNIIGAYEFTASPFNSQDHTVYEIEIPIPPMPPAGTAGMVACDPDTPSGRQAGAFVGTITPLATGGVEIQRVVTPVCFSVDGLQANPAEGLHPNNSTPNDVFSLGMAGGHALPTQGEVFQSSGVFPWVPDMTNAVRLSGALGAGPGPHAPPPAAAPMQITPGALGLVPGDNINAMSYGKDGGNVLHFSVDPNAIGMPNTAVNFEAVTSPPPGMVSPATPSNNNGGDPGNEAAGDIFVSRVLANMFGAYPRVMPAWAALKLNSLECEELFLGLQASAAMGTVLGPPEDDLDALEMSDTGDWVWGVDTDGDGLVDPSQSRNVFFSIDPWSPSYQATSGAVRPCDILITRDGARTHFVFASGVVDIGLQLADDIDALAMSDTNQLGQLDLGDSALFSLAPGSPTLALLGASPGDVFSTSFTGTFGLFTSAASLGLLPEDNLNAMDISVAGGILTPPTPTPGDCDGDGDVDLDDFLILKINFGRTGVTGGPSEGDLDSDGDVDLDDFMILKMNFGISP